MSRSHLPSSRQSFTILALVILIIILSLSLSLELVTALFFGCIVASIASMYLGRSWEEVQGDLVKGISNGLGAILILMIIGAVIASWISAGTIPTLIVYGLRIIQAPYFLPSAFLLSSITSILIGSSFGTIATIGIVLMGIGEVLGVSQAMTAGVIVSGAMLGDQISPLSDSTNLTASIAQVPLMDHVKSMIKISIPAALIAIVLYFIMNNQLTLESTNMQAVTQLSNELGEIFKINFWALLPIFTVLSLLLMKMPAIPALAISYLVASLVAILFQGQSLEDWILVTANGYVSQTDNDLIDSLLSQGGIGSMLDTTAIILFGTGMGGILEGCQILDVILTSLRKAIKTSFHLVFYSLASGYMMLAATGEMYVSIILPGKILGPAYDDMGIDRTLMSRSLEASATLGCGMLPWGIVTKYAMDVLDVGYEFIPYSLVPIIVPILTLLVAFYQSYKKKPV